ncbi:MAG: AAA family ATPase [Alphaproteobacteria bacterium]|nr:AAA family ATPase [Alphaproteobacteria bacterium]
MILSEQTDIIEALSTPQTYGKNIHKVDVRRSHIAIIFFAGNYVYKLKRAVIYPGVDFSTAEKRKLACIAEMKRSTVYAPHLIIGVKPIKRLKNGTIKIGGTSGEEIDTVIVEKRLPNKAILSFLLPSPDFDRFETMDLAEHLADLHAKAKVFHNKWGVDVIQNIILETESILSCFPSSIDLTQLNTLTKQSLEILKKNENLIKFRQKSGFVKKCHGDLLLSNIAYNKGKFLFFSPIEYNDSLDCIDTLYDLSFLTMDLEAKGLRRISNILFNHYMSYMNDIEGFPLMGLYQSMRAASRAAICAKTSALLTGNEKQQAILQTQKYFKLACHFLINSSPILIACGGLSGSGKSRVAREIGGLISPSPGAVILRDDVVKKQITGLAPRQRFNKTIDTPAFEKVVYEVLRQQASCALQTGSTVIVDALFHNENERLAIQALADSLNIPFIGLWMDAPLNVRKQRLQKRKNTPSDNRKEKELESQLCLEIGNMIWHLVNTDMPKEDTIAHVIKILKKCPNIIL